MAEFFWRAGRSLERATPYLGTETQISPHVVVGAQGDEAVVDEIRFRRPLLQPRPDPKRT